MSAQHTPGPWRWEFSQQNRQLQLVGGRPQFDLTIIDFARWGMGGATMRLRDTAHDGMNLMYRVHERQDWITPEPGRKHHKHWHQLLTHPDAQLIEAAPGLLKALQVMLRDYAAVHDIGDVEMQPAIYQARAAIAKATSQA